MKFSIFEFILWTVCGFVWWSLVHLAFVFIPGRLWMAGNPTIVAGAIVGAAAYLKFSAASIKYWARTPRVFGLCVPLLFAGLIIGVAIGWSSAKGTSTGPASIIPGYVLPPTNTWRLFNAFCGGAAGIAGNLGIWFSLWHLSDRKGLFAGCLVVALVLIYVAVPLVLVNVLR